MEETTQELVERFKRAIEWGILSVSLMQRITERLESLQAEVDKLKGETKCLNQ